MITYADMQAALKVARERRLELQFRLRRAALDLVHDYRRSLQMPEGDGRVRAGEAGDDIHDMRPIPAIKLGEDDALRFIIATEFGNGIGNELAIPVSLSVRECDGGLSVLVEGDDPLFLVPDNAGGDSFTEVTDRIKRVVIDKMNCCT